MLISRVIIVFFFLKTKSVQISYTCILNVWTVFPVNWTVVHRMMQTHFWWAAECVLGFCRGAGKIVKVTPAISKVNEKWKWVLPNVQDVRKVDVRKIDVRKSFWTRLFFCGIPRWCRKSDLKVKSPMTQSRSLFCRALKTAKRMTYVRKIMWKIHNHVWKIGRKLLRSRKTPWFLDQKITE